MLIGGSGGGEREGNPEAPPEMGNARGREKLPEAAQIPRVECREVVYGL